MHFLNRRDISKKMCNFAAAMERFLKHNRSIIVTVVLILFGSCLALVSFGNHLCFRTYGLDLGLYAKSVFDYSHLHSNDSTFFLWEPSNLLGDHFDLLLMLISPLAWLVRADWLLLIVQLLSAIIGALGIYKLARLRTKDTLLPLLMLPMPLVTFGTWHAFGFDFHSNVVGAMLLPWLVYFIESKNRGHLFGAAMMVLLIAICKESSALWLCFVLVALLIEHRKDKPLRHFLIWTLALSTIYFIVVSIFVMPSLNDGGSQGFWRYDYMGATAGEVAKWIITHPLQAVKNIFIDFTSAGDKGIFKQEFFICMLLSGGILCLLKPNYLIMLILPITMKMLSRDADAFWGITYHYNVELCMVCCVAAVEVLCRKKTTTIGFMHTIGIIVLLLTIGTTLYTIGHPHTSIRKQNVNIFKSEHYRQPDFNAEAARRMIKEIPSDASVCAVTMFTPHLAARDSVYIYPMGLGYGAEYFLVLRDHWAYYEGEADQAAALIADTKHYSIIDSDNDQLYLLRHKVD